MRQMEADLHLHSDGLLSMDVARTLAEGIKYDLEGKDLKKLLCMGGDCVNLAEYSSYSGLPGILLQTKDALELASCNLVKRLTVQGPVYAETRFASQLHRQKGLTQEQAMEAAVRGVQTGSRGSGMYTGILFCAMVNGSDRNSEETLGLSEAYLRKGVVGVGIAGPEGLVPMKRFEGMFRRIYQTSVSFTAHTGECGDHRNIALAMPYGARRIGRSCATICSEVCMDLLKWENITLEMCIASSPRTKTAESTEAHPLKEFHARGVRVTYNTDDMMVSDIDLEREAVLIAGRMGLTQKDLIRMNETAVEAESAGAGVREGTLGRMREQPGI